MVHVSGMGPLLGYEGSSFLCCLVWFNQTNFLFLQLNNSIDTMKRTLLLLFAFMAVLQVSAQEKETTRDTTATITIEDLSTKLNKLQHDYDYLQCDYELHKVIADFDGLSNSISITSNSLITYCFNARYDRALYNSYVDNYNTKRELFQSQKEKSDSVKKFVMLKVFSSNFTEEEINVIRSYFELTEKSIAAVESALKHYDVALETFRSKR